MYVYYQVPRGKLWLFMFEIDNREQKYDQMVDLSCWKFV